MPRLVLADEDHVRRIHEETCAIWGGGLAAADHLAVWRDCASTPWATKHVRFLVWADERGHELSCLKLYRPLVRVRDVTDRAAVLAAIFTPRARRRQGHATEMLRNILADERRRGTSLAMLFTDIGTAFYRNLGFVELPANEQWGSLAHTGPKPDQWELRSMRASDAEEVRRAHDADVARRPLAMLRDGEHWAFLRKRTSSFFDRLGSSDIRPWNRVALYRGRFAGYIIAVRGRGEWNVREVADTHGAVGRMAAIMSAGAAEARREGLNRFYGWLPEELVAELHDWRLHRNRRKRAVPMILPLARPMDPSILGSAAAAYIPFQDQF